MANAIEIVAVPTIVTLVFLVLSVYKKVVGDAEKFIRFIPLIACGLGIILGIAAYYVAPEIIPTSNVFAAALIGGASGLAATGTHQVFKQLGKKDGDGTDKE